MKWLDGAELASYMQAEQAVEVRRLKAAWAEQGAKGRAPRLLILQDQPNPISELYVARKQAYAAEIGVETEYRVVAPADLAAEITRANDDPLIHGMIVQLPILGDEAVLEAIAPAKDVDGLASAQQIFTSATAEAINHLLVAYDVELKGKKIAIIGYGRLVGKPLAALWRSMGLEVTVFRSKDAARLPEVLPEFDLVVSATGVAGLVKPEMLKKHAVVVDAGTATDKNGVAGDLAPEVFARPDLTLTPKIGGVGPVTVATLFAHLLRAARDTI